MSRNEFMQRLESLLCDMPEVERAEALNYYQEYFNDAGAENEQDVILSLGSPEKIAATIKEGIGDNEGKMGEYSENGFQGYYQEPKEEVSKRVLNDRERDSSQKKTMSGGMLALIILLCIFALPILGPSGIAILSVIFGIACAVVAVLLSAAIAGVALCVAGVAVLIAAFPTFFISPLVGFLLIGIGFLLSGIGVLLTILGIWILIKAIPPLIRGIVKLCKLPFRKKEGNGYE